ncbi:putative baseplate assembly protein [Geodermatophilus sp. SYSU D00742]
MPDRPPPLDARTYEEFKRDLQLLIPRYTPEWTDWNESDPGTTLLELFAWLADSVVYRLNQVPDALYLKLLELIGIQPAAALPARVHLTFTPNAGSIADPIVVPLGTVVSADGSDGRPVYFETEVALGVTRFPLSALQVFDGTTHGVSGAFAPFGESPAPGNAVYLGFGPVPPDVTRSAFPAQLRLHVVSAAGRGAVASDVAAGTSRPAPPVTVQWEYLDQLAPRQRWTRLEVRDDASVALTRDGDVVLDAPPARATAHGPLGAVAEPHYWVRGRLVSGVYPDGAAPLLEAIEANTVPAVGLRTVRDEPVGTSNGLPGQRMQLANGLIDAASLRVVVTTGTRAVPWTAREDLVTSSPTDTHFVLDSAAGVLVFGDGAHALIPPAGSEVTASYRFGGGAGSNIAAGSATALLGPVTGVSAVTNPRPAVGGQDRQTTEELTRQAPARLRAQQRAVTAEDLVDEALRVGGVARATVIRSAHPEYPGVQVPGAVTVLVLPSAPPQGGVALPQPTPELKEAVARHLDPLRPITAEVYVDGPTYREVRVRARVEIRATASPDAVGDELRRALQGFLSPLPVPGPAGPSQPRDFGEDFHPTSLFRALLDVDGVVAVPALTIWVDGEEVPITVPVPLGQGELLGDSGQHVLIVVPRRDAQGSR